MTQETLFNETSNEIEIWKPIPIEGYEDYQVSNLGRVKSLKFGKERILKYQKHINGYIFVGIWGNSKQKFYDIHRLVGITFLKEYHFEDSQVNHKNGIKTDNRACNLEWVTHSENIKHAISTGLSNQKGEKHTQSKLTEIQAIEIYNAKGKIKSSELAIKYNISQSVICNIWTKRKWKHIHNSE